MFDGVGIMVREELVEDVIEAVKIDERLMKIKIVQGRRIAHTSIYVEKQEFMEKLSDIVMVT